MALTFVVAGGGFSGVETMGEVLEMVHRTQRYFPNIQKEEIKAVLIQRGDNLLKEMPDPLGKYATEQLEQRGVRVLLNTGIKSASSTTVSTSDGEVINTMTIVTTIGNAPSEFIKSLPYEFHRGKIVTNRHLQVKGYTNIWALGDAAAIPMEDRDADGEGGAKSEESLKQIAPPTAQFAVQEAKVVAKNIMRLTQSKPLRSFNYSPKGMLASLGAYKGVAQLGKIRLTGLPAWFIWRFLYIGMLPGFATRIRVGLNWLFDYFLPRTIVQMAHAQTPAIRCTHYRKDEVVYDKNEIIPGFFIVGKGRFKLEFDEEGVGSSEIIFEQGDHGGNQAIHHNSLTRGRLTALEDGELLMISRDDFKQLCSAIPVVEAHYNIKTDDKIKALHR